MADMKVRRMVSMELSDEEQLDCVMPTPICDRPKFPWGLRISLCEKDFDKLGLDPQSAEVGGMIHGHFMGRITSVSHNDTEGGDNWRVEIQIEDLEIESEDEENEEN
jgi:hypothetical protein